MSVDLAIAHGSCWFCGRDNARVVVLAQDGMPCICDECLGMCREILADTTWKHEKESPCRRCGAVEHPCSFCGALKSNGARVISGPHVFICEECVCAAPEIAS